LSAAPRATSEHQCRLVAAVGGIHGQLRVGNEGRRRLPRVFTQRQDQGRLPIRVRCVGVGTGFQQLLNPARVVQGGGADQIGLGVGCGRRKPYQGR
jgi:hypothetical protein